MDLTQILNNVQPQESKGDLKALPKGVYNVMIEEVEGKQNESTGAAGVNVKMRVFGNKFNNYVLYDYMLIKGNENALKYSLPKLKKLGVVMESEDTSKWLGKQASVQVSVDNKDESKNIIWSYDSPKVEDNTPVNNNKDAVITANDLPF